MSPQGPQGPQLSFNGRQLLLLTMLKALKSLWRRLTARL